VVFAFDRPAALRDLEALTVPQVTPNRGPWRGKPQSKANKA